MGMTTPQQNNGQIACEDIGLARFLSVAEAAISVNRFTGLDRIDANRALGGKGRSRGQRGPNWFSAAQTET
jgi:hypothetical protein